MKIGHPKDAWNGRQSCLHLWASDDRRLWINVYPWSWMVGVARVTQGDGAHTWTVAIGPVLLEYFPNYEVTRTI